MPNKKVDVIVDFDLDSLLDDGIREAIECLRDTPVDLPTPQPTTQTPKALTGLQALRAGRERMCPKCGCGEYTDCECGVDDD